MTSLLHALTICWGVTMVALAALLIYRSLVAMKEENLLALDPAEWQLEQQQLAILSRLRQIGPMIKTLALISLAFLGVIVGIVVYSAVEMASPTFR